MKRIITILFTLITMASTISAQTLDSNWPKGNPNDAYAEYFTGNSYLAPIQPKNLAVDLGLPENEEILMILDLGFAAEGTGPLKTHFSRKPIEETVTYL